MIRKTLAASLVAAPILFTATEFTRLLVEADATGEPGAALARIQQSRSTWELFGWLVFVTAPVWVAAMVGLVESLRQARERWATVTGIIAVASAVSWAMHQASYVELNAVVAHHYGSASQVALAMYDGVGGTGMEDATLIGMALGLLLGPLLVLLGHARAGLMPWWAFACVPAWMAITLLSGGMSPIFALANLLLLPPFVLVARTLARPAARLEADVAASGKLAVG